MERRVRVVKLRKKVLPVHVTPVTKSGRVYKVLRKYQPEPGAYTPGDPDEDWDLEQRGEVGRFLRMKNYLTGDYELDQSIHRPVFDESGNVIAHSIVGPAASFRAASLPKEPPKPRRRPRRLPVDWEARLQQKLQQIDSGKASEQAWRQAFLTELTVGERLAFCRQQKVLDKFKDTYKHWVRIEDNLSRRLRQDLTGRGECNSQDPGRSRSVSPSTNKSLQFRTFNQTPLKKRPSETMLCDDLQVTGTSKLPLEIETAQAQGLGHLQLQLLPKERTEEVIAEHRDLKLKA